MFLPYGKRKQLRRSIGGEIVMMMQGNTNLFHINEIIRERWPLSRNNEKLISQMGLFFNLMTFIYWKAIS
ncbi:hypothetical protein ADM99_01785 [Leptolinea tardivitalis]|uniref:Uncharacterized protein n=1 Tax=Leptolinea tardivitalis TaxID=229920 RepID=A0A0P6XQ10_9CHLR|nr:hypothetical protein ADM99_01785 [Leptolinea tardivitalis]